MQYIPTYLKGFYPVEDDEILKMGLQAALYTSPVCLCHFFWIIGRIITLFLVSYIFQFYPPPPAAFIFLVDFRQQNRDQLANLVDNLVPKWGQEYFNKSHDKFWDQVEEFFFEDVEAVGGC